MSPTERTTMVSLRLTPEEHRALSRIAERDGLSQSDVLRQMLRARMALMKAARPTTSGTPISGVQERVLADHTVVHDMRANRSFMRIAGHVTLPVGAEVELDDHTNARVMRMRLLAGSPAALCIDVVRDEA